MDQFKKTLIVYQKNSLDAFASAAIAGKFLDFDRVDLMASSYIEPVPDFSKYENVYILGFSWDPQQLLPATVELKNVVLIDHHPFSFKWSGIDLPENLFVKVDIELSTSIMTHKFFYPNDYPGLLYKMIRDCDQELFEINKSYEICAALRNTPMMKEKDWDLFLQTAAEIHNGSHTASDLAAKGETILEYNEQLIKNINERSGVDYMADAELEMRLVNIPHELASQCADYLIKHFAYDVVITYEDLIHEKRRCYTVHSSKTSNFRADAFAEQYHGYGGGHQYAATFYTPRAALFPF